MLCKKILYVIKRRYYKKVGTFRHVLISQGTETYTKQLTRLISASPYDLLQDPEIVSSPYVPISKEINLYTAAYDEND